MYRIVWKNRDKERENFVRLNTIEAANGVFDSLVNDIVKVEWVELYDNEDHTVRAHHN